MNIVNSLENSPIPEGEVAPIITESINRLVDLISVLEINLAITEDQDKSVEESPFGIVRTHKMGGQNSLGNPNIFLNSYFSTTALVVVNNGDTEVEGNHHINLVSVHNRVDDTPFVLYIETISNSFRFRAMSVKGMDYNQVVARFRENRGIDEVIDYEFLETNNEGVVEEKRSQFQNGRFQYFFVSEGQKPDSLLKLSKQAVAPFKKVAQIQLSEKGIQLKEES